jgi:hypothetical protein
VNHQNPNILLPLPRSQKQRPQEKTNTAKPAITELVLGLERGLSNTERIGSQQLRISLQATNRQKITAERTETNAYVNPKPNRQGLWDATNISLANHLSISMLKNLNRSNQNSTCRQWENHCDNRSKYKQQDTTPMVSKKSSFLETFNKTKIPMEENNLTISLQYTNSLSDYVCIDKERSCL